MSERMFYRVGLGVAALGLAFAVVTWPRSEAQPRPEGDGPGPNLVLEIDGSTQGEVVIDLLPDIAPRHVARIVELTRDGAYTGIVFHRVIPGFMAQTGDVEFGQLGSDLARVGTGGSDKPDLAAEFSGHSFDRGTVGMARSASPDSANSQFFIVTAPAPHLNGGYTLFGRVISGMEVVDAIKAGSPAQNGAVADPDYIAAARIEG